MIDIKTVSQCISSDYCKGWNDAVKSIGRCGECKHSSYYEEYGNRWCNLNLGSRIVRENDYCNHFEPKEREENAVD